MPFAFLLGDHPVYVLITQTSTVTLCRFLVPLCSPQCAIYTRYKGSELGEVLVAGGVIADGSVDRALQGLKQDIQLCEESLLHVETSVKNLLCHLKTRV